MYKINHTVEYSYNAVQYNMIMYIILRWLGQNMNVSLNPQKVLHSLPELRDVFYDEFEDNHSFYNNNTL